MKTVFKDIIGVLENLKKKYPSLTLASHISIATDNELWGLSDKELLNLLEKYEGLLEASKSLDVNKAIKEGLDINHILDEEEDSTS